MKKRNWMAGVCGAAVMGLLIAGTGTASAGTIPTGFQVGGFDLSGMTREEADQTIEKSIGEMENQTISIRVEGHEVQTTAAELGFSWVNQNEIDEEVEKLSGGNLLRRYLNQKELEQSGVDLQIETAVDEAKVAEFVQTRCAEFTTAPQDAVITHENGDFQVSQSSAGQEVDIDATTKALNEALAGGLSEPVSVDATVKNAEPTRTTEALSTIQDALGTFSTGFNPGNVSRSKNLRNGEDQRHGSDAGRRIFGLYMADPIYGGKWLCIGRFLCERSGSRYGRRWRLPDLHDALQCSASGGDGYHPAPESFDDCYLRSGIAGFGDCGYL